jgi:mRNA interferase MazF
VRRGEVWWASLPEPVGSGPGFRRPVLVVQGNDFSESRIGTVICAAITTNTRLAEAPGNMLLRRKESGLLHDSVVNVSQLITVDKRFFGQRVGPLASKVMQTGVGATLGAGTLGRESRSAGSPSRCASRSPRDECLGSSSWHAP